ncbi:alkaline phytoceramidase [Algibacter marinivivus]|uniref:Alkaline phytoceramidase n=1 Tax=Algibacter marinivivus TaxID=2100723 RepID=A0A2U2X9R4_9FLAO|nr:ceramidase domain-containing protein [Algibacter marinivivus]PWH84512.1 alkaline phytoceramidase [Algibacter marinivivus]
MNKVQINQNKEKIGFYVITIFAITIMFLMPPINQDGSYHQFVDSNKIANIPNFWNVISNIPFLLVGILGLYKLNFITQNKIQYLIFFSGIILVSIGSSYYHLNPNNTTLVWDRLPMTIVFMSLVSIIISEFVNNKKGQLLLIPMLFIGLLSIFYWIVFNDLRLYVFVQFYPLLLIPVILVFYKSNYNLVFGYWLLLIAYIIAKVFEYFDEQIFDNLGVISGHSLKHLVAAIGLYILTYTFIKRNLINLNN